jgi:short-subunit dehydrogenase
MTVEDFDVMFASNVRAAYFLVGALAPAMAAKGSGSIINISSMAGRIGMPNGAAYGATKAALASLAQSWTAEYSPRGVRVNAVAAGPIYTRPEARQIFDRLGKTTALQRAAEPREIAEVVAFLASPGASYVTGAIVAADGGRTDHLSAAARQHRRPTMAISLLAISIDGSDVTRLAQFWADVLDQPVDSATDSFATITNPRRASAHVSPGPRRQSRQEPGPPRPRYRRL